MINKNLYQKHHGLPGLGVIGETGDAGTNGNSIYFGFVKDFFDGMQVQGNSNIMFAKRKPVEGSVSIRLKYNALMNSLYNLIIDSSNFPDTANLIKKYMESLLNSSIYYSGIQYDNKSSIKDISLYANYRFDVDTMPWLTALMLSSIDDASILNDASSFAEVNIANVLVQDGGVTLSYVDTYDYVEDSTLGFYSSPVNATIDKLHITYEPEDAISGLNGINFNYSDPSIYTNLDADSQEINSSINLALSYIKLVIGIGNPTYNTNTNDFYETTNLLDPNDTSYVYYDDNNYVSNLNSSIYTKNAIQLLNSVLFDDEFVINDNGHMLTYYGINSSILYNNGVVDSSLILNEVLNSSLSYTYNNIYDAIDKYVNRVTMSLAGGSGDGYIRWISDEDNIITIPTNLKSTYKAGDIIYFYTDQQDYLTSNKITNMVVITENIEGCDLNTLIANSNLVSPFEIRYLENNNGRVLSTNKIITLSLDKVLNSRNTKDLNRFSYNSLNNIIASYNDSDIILVNACDTSLNTYLQLNAVNEGNEYKLEVLSNSSYGTIKTDQIKLDSLLIKNKSYNCNVESYSAIYDPYIILDDNKFIVPVKEKDLYEYVTEDKLYIGLTLFGSDYVNTSYTDISNYVYGYELYNIEGQLILSEITSEDQLIVFLPNLIPSQSVDSSINTYSIISEFTLTHTANSSIMELDWDNITFTYSKLLMIGKYIYFVYDSSVVPTNSPYGETNTIKILMSAYDNNYYTYASEYIDSKYYYHESGNIVKSLNAVYLNNVTIASDSQVITRNVEPYYSYFYINTFVGNKSNGLKHYSRMSKIDYLVNMSEGYLNDYSCEVIGDNDSSSQSTVTNNILFETSNITSELNSNGLLTISASDNISIKKIYFNHNLISSSIGALYRNSWASIVLIENSSDGYKFVVNTDSNVPNIYNTSTLDLMSINEYMISLCDNSSNGDAPLFTYINNKKLPLTKDRYVSVQVEYEYTDSSVTAVETYNMVLPGFKDSRGIPDISLNIHTDMESIEKYNSMDNGVLCNQFVTYMDINIGNFDTMWERFLDNSTNISMDLEFTNINSDIDWVSKYAVSNVMTSRSTVKIIGDANIDASNHFISESINNYISLNTNFVDINNADVSYNYIDISNNFKIQTSKYISSEADCSTYNINGTLYVLCDASIMDAMSLPEYIYKGLNDHITISMNGLTPSMLHDNSTYKLRIKYEIGNPMISNLYLRFALNKVVIHYDSSLNDEPKTFTARVPELKVQCNTYLYKQTSNRTETYKVISNKLDVMVNPISYVMCPIEEEQYITDIQGVVMKTGSSLKIGRKMSFYESNVYDLSTLTSNDVSANKNNLYYDWSSFKLKKAYLQDNIRNINLSYVAFDTNKIDATHNYLIGLNDPLLLSTPASLDLINGEKYIDIIYNASIMNPRLRDDQYTFYYNNEEYERDRYNQISNNCPVFASDSLDIEVRSQEAIDAMDIWNFEYLNSEKKSTDIVFVGNLNKYGNGYMYLKNSADTSQYDDQSILSLRSTKAYNNVYIYDSSIYGDLSHDEYNDYEPYNGEYFRTFLYDMDYNYPYCINNKITPFLIVTDFDYIAKYLVDSSISINQQYSDKVDTLINKYGSDNVNNNMIPYSTIFDIYPRVAYNTDYETINVLMLRRPSIEMDYDTSTDVSCYQLNTRYFELTAGQEIKKLNIPFNIM